MAINLGDRVKETSTSTGSGNFALAGAATGFRTFNAAVGTSVYFTYAIVHQTANEWEVGLGYLSASTTLVRSTLYSSSTGSTVSFSAGTKDVFITQPAKNSSVNNAVFLGNVSGNPEAFVDWTAMGASVSIGNSYTTAYGASATASGTESTAIGYVAGATGPYTTVVGRGANSSVQYGTAIGYQASVTTNNYGTAVGQYSSVTGNNGVAIGGGNNVSGTNSVALGVSVAVGGPYTVAIGSNINTYTADSAISIGYSSTAQGNNSVAVGAFSSVPPGTSSVAIGCYNAISSAGNSIVITTDGTFIPSAVTNTVVIAAGVANVGGADGASYLYPVRLNVSPIGTQYALYWESGSYEISAKSGGGAAATLAKCAFNIFGSVNVFGATNNNCASVTLLAPGVAQVNFTTPLSSAAPAVVSTIDSSSPGAYRVNCDPANTPFVIVYFYDVTGTLNFPMYPVGANLVVPA